MATMCIGNHTLGGRQESSAELPPGFRFHPTDEELVGYYLTKKVSTTGWSVKAIVDVDLNKCEPWDLPERASIGENEWYFFSLRDRKYPTGTRTNRATEAGYWKATGKDRDVLDSRRHSLVGMKKTLVFYKGRAPKGEKTSWIMHEYRLETDSSNHLNQQPRFSKDEWVVCRIFQKSAGSKKSFLYTDMRDAYQLNDPHSSPPGHLDNSPNPTVTDEGDCDACTATESCYKCKEQFQDTTNMTQRDVTSNLSWILRNKCGANGSVPIGAQEMDISNMMKFPFYDPIPNMRYRPDLATVPQTFVNSSMLSLNEGLRMRPKMEPYNNCVGEDEAESSQRGGQLDYCTWGGNSGLYQDAPCESPMIHLPSLNGGTESSCITGSFSDEQQVGGYSFRHGLPDVSAGPGDPLQGCMWTYS